MPRRMNVQCPNCGQPFTAVVETIVDPAQDPEAKNRLLSGETNLVRCPNCGTAITIAAPILYHDASKEMLISFVPMELNLTKDQQERAVGELMRELTGRLPKEAMRGYLFQPRSAFTMQGLIEQVLQGDGVTPEMMAESMSRARLIETFIGAAEDELPALVQTHDAQVDAMLLQTMAVMAQRMLSEGRADIAERIALVQQVVIQNSSFGQSLLEQARNQESVVEQVAEEIRAMGAGAQRADFIDLAVRLGADDQYLQALVGLARPAFDYQFFQDFTTAIAQAPADDRDDLEALRDRLVELTQAVDAQTQAAVQNAARLLQAILNSDERDAMIEANLGAFDDVFMTVLSANLQQAEQTGSEGALEELQDVYTRVLMALRERMQPELRFINDLLATPSDDDARALLAEQADTFGPQLLAMMDAVEEVLASRGETALLERLAFLREEAAQVLG